MEFLEFLEDDIGIYITYDWYSTSMPTLVITSASVCILQKYSPRIDSLSAKLLDHVKPNQTKANQTISHEIKM